MILHPQTRPQQSRRAAFTLLEVLIVVAIIVILAGVGGVYVFRSYEDAKIGLARSNAINLGKACETFMVKYDRYPESLNELVQPPSGAQPFVEAGLLTDPWNKPYQYDPSGQHNGGLKPDVYTTSPSGEMIGNWKQ
jgi:general secretion pathway protein G